MVKEENFAADGADEEMLGAGTADEKLTERRDEVKFIKGDQQNGDAKIDIGNLNGKPVSVCESDSMTIINLTLYLSLLFCTGFHWHEQGGANEVRQ